MENATKALLIAAAVLVAILIISLGLAIYQKAAQTIDSVDFSGQEVQAFNEKFDKYDGTNRRGTEVNAMLSTVLNSNLQNSAAGLTPGNGEPKFVNVTGDITLDATDTALGDRAQTSKLYTISVGHDAKTGFVNEIDVQEN